MPKKKGKHLDFDDRCVIEDMLKHGSSFREIARRLNVSPSTVSDEMRRNRTWKRTASFLFDGPRRCIRYLTCTEQGVCGTCPTPQKMCKKCKSEDCYGFCKKFETRRCPRLEKAPYVCNFCLRPSICERTSPVRESNATAVMDRAWTSSPIEVTWFIVSPSHVCGNLAGRGVRDQDHYQPRSTE